MSRAHDPLHSLQEVQYKGTVGWAVYGLMGRLGDRVSADVDWGRFVANYSVQCEQFFAGLF